MKAHVVCLRNPFNPGQRDTTAIRRRRKISNLAPRTRMPVIAYHNGRVILRREWHRRVRDGDVVAFVVLPQGGGDGGKNPLQLVAMMALMYFSGGIAGSIHGALWGAGIELGSMGLAIIKAGVGLVGNALISAAFAGKPSSPTPQVQSSIAAPSPTYSLGAQGNMARLESAIPVQYGRMQAYPDFGAQPYAEYVGNEQFVYQLICLGQGSFEIEDIRIEDTPISSFAEITYEVIEPGGSLTLFPSNVVTATEVSGQLAEYDTWLGGFIANASGTTANAIAVDMVCPRGVYYANDSGGLNPVTITFTVEARTVDSSGAPTGSWVTLGTETIDKGTSTPQRLSYRYTGLSGRYEVRLKRTSAAGGTSRYADDLNWAGLRAYLPETRTWPGKTMVAMRMRASNNLSNQAARKVNIIATRKLPIWDGANWTAPQVTRSPAWAMADALRADYGGRMPDARIDIDQLVALAAVYAARGDTFDGRFDSTITLWEGVRRIGQAVRTLPYQQGGIVHFARDQAATVPVCLFNMRNIVRGSFSVDYLMPTEETADTLDVAYFDQDVWSRRRVAAALPGSAAERPLKIDLFGVTQRAQAYREGLYLAAVNRYRRKRITFATEMEGFIPSYGDLITVSHDMPAWGTSGEVVAVSAAFTGAAIAGWTVVSGTVTDSITGPDGVTASRTVTDASAFDRSSLNAPIEIVSVGSTLTRTLFVKKDASTYQSAIVFNLYRGSDGGLVINPEIQFRTDTGAISGTVNSFSPAEVVSFDSTWWRVTVSYTLTDLQDRLVVKFLPAAVIPGPPGLKAATVWSGDPGIPALTLSEPVSFDSGDHYISLRTRAGAAGGPYLVTAGANDHEVLVSGALDEAPYTGGAAERTYFAFGKGEAWRQPARVVSVKPRNLYEVEIEAINEDASVHTADEGATAPAAQYSSLPSLYTAPVVSGLTVRSKLGDPSVALCSWRSAAGARFYVVDVSSDGDTWSRVGEPTTNNIAVPAVYGNNTLIRVAAYGFTLGPSVQASYAATSDYFWSGTDSNLFWSGTDTNPYWSA